MMSIATLKKVLARQRQLLCAKVTKPIAIQNVSDEARVSKSELKKVRRTLQNLQTPHCDTIIRHLRCNNCFFEKLLVRGSELGNRMHESMV